MPDHLKKTTPYLYADDIQISSSSYDLETLAQNLNDDLNNIQRWLLKNKLQYHPTKTSWFSTCEFYRAKRIFLLSLSN